jgi:hypothetical protein
LTLPSPFRRQKTIGSPLRRGEGEAMRGRATAIGATRRKRQQYRSSRRAEGSLSPLFVRDANAARLQSFGPMISQSRRSHHEDRRRFGRCFRSARHGPEFHQCLLRVLQLGLARGLGPARLQFTSMRATAPLSAARFCRSLIRQDSDVSTLNPPFRGTKIDRDPLRGKNGARAAGWRGTRSLSGRRL